jgi:SAM-dependent methyltransferase
VLDFVCDPARTAERAFYDEWYAERTEPRRKPVEDYEEAWVARHNILARLTLKHVMPLTGKRVLLLGNGLQARELWFLTRSPAALVFSDLSATAVRAIRDGHDLGPYGSRASFAAIDAYDLPFPDETVDIVYGFAFVHHLPDLGSFLAEVRRVLAPGGRAVFVDDAYSPIWQRAKLGVLAPVMRYTHRLGPVSPEDRRFTIQGGFREDDLARRIRLIGGRPYFSRQSFLYYFWTRAADRLLPFTWKRVTRHPAVELAWIAADRQLERFEAVRRNQIRLVWGFEVP